MENYINRDETAEKCCSRKHLILQTISLIENLPHKCMEICSQKENTFSLTI